MDTQNIHTAQGHWLMAKMGKRVLRPGGVELTTQLIESLSIGKDDNIVEFAPGLGLTAQMAWKYQPKSWIGVELDDTAAALLQKKFSGDGRQVIKGNAADSTLPNEVADKVYGEAMLTMQGETQKSKIIREAYRILKPGGFYGIHEIELTPDTISEEMKAEIQKELSGSIRINARPLTSPEWTKLFEAEGFEIKTIKTNPMHLLEPKRMIQDEGLLRVLKIRFNMLTHPATAKRIKAMRAIFRKYEKQMKAIMIIAQKKKA